MPRFYVIPERCQHDGVCATVCPAHVIRGSVGKEPVMRPGGKRSCIACGHCMAFCPHGAACVDVLPLEEMAPLDKKQLPSPESFAMLAMSRRSVRCFTKKAVPEDVLGRILALPRYAPSAKNRRPVRWVAVYEREKLRAIGDLIADWLEEGMADTTNAHPFAEAHGLLRAWRAGLDPFFRGAPHLALAVTPKGWVWNRQDAAIALTYLELAALVYNVGACWAGYVTCAVQKYVPLQKFLGVGLEEKVCGGQMLGYMALRPVAAAPRAPFPIHWL